MTFSLELITLEKGENAGIRPLFGQNRRLGGGVLFRHITVKHPKSFQFYLEKLTKVLHTVKYGKKEINLKLTLVTAVSNRLLIEKAKSMRMSWWSYLVMLLVYLLYLFIGALVFRRGVSIIWLSGALCDRWYSTL